MNTGFNVERIKELEIALEELKDTCLASREGDQQQYKGTKWV